jgi:hypothetical protein
MGNERESDENWFRKGGLVDFTSHEEVRLGARDRASNSGDEGYVGEMEGGE